jgi:hypothetical protein
LTLKLLCVLFRARPSATAASFFALATAATTFVLDDIASVNNPAMATSKPDVVVGIDFGMTCTGKYQLGRLIDPNFATD